MIRVLLADDHQLVRSGLEQLLSGAPDVEVVAAAANGWRRLPWPRRAGPTWSSWTS